jgi:hypothetical protein
MVLTSVFTGLVRNEPRIASQMTMVMFAYCAHFYIHGPGTKRGAHSISDDYGYAR